MQCFLTFWWSFFILCDLFRLIFRLTSLLFEASVSQTSQVNPIWGPIAVSQTVASLFKSKMFPKSKSRFWCRRSSKSGEGTMSSSIRIPTSSCNLGQFVFRWWCSLWANKVNVQHDKIRKIIIVEKIAFQPCFDEKTSLWNFKCWIKLNRSLK